MCCMVPILQTGFFPVLAILFLLALLAFFVYLWISIEPSESIQNGEEKKFCSTCGVEVNPEDAFCPNCGHSLTEETEGKQLCLVCDTQADVSDEFCSNCGNSLSA